MEDTFMFQGARHVRLVCAVTLVAAFAAAPAAVDAQTARGSFQRTLTVDGPADIEVVTGSGRIEVRAGGTGRIEISGEIRAGRWGWSRSQLSAEERVRRLEANPPIRQTGNAVVIGRIDDDDLRDVSISYTLLVPADSALRSKTGSGSQHIDGVRGRVQSSTGSGSIEAREVGGLSASTGSGSIAADRVDGAFEASTGSGSIRGTGIAGAIRARTGSGTIEVAQSGTGNVEVSSSSGTVRLRGVRGAVDASTTSGALYVEGEPQGEWRLAASSGSVHVNVPDGTGFDLDARTGSGGIDLGMPVSAVSSMSKRTLRGAVQGGGPRLYVRTSSGGIHID
jgi:hypothetical protein